MNTFTPLPSKSVPSSTDGATAYPHSFWAKTIRTSTACLSIILATSASLVAATWDGGGADDEYSTALNWSDDLVPTSATDSTQEISGAFTVERTINSSSGRTFVSNGAVLNVTSGDHSDSRPGNTIRNFVGSGSTGTVNMSGASTTYGIGHLLAIAHASNSNGTFNHMDGDLNISRGSNTLLGGYGGIFSRGHTISIGGDSTSSNVTGLYEISAGSLRTRTGVAVGNNGTFSIVGSSATEIRLGGSNADTGWFALSADGTLKAAIDAGGITPIFIEDRTNTSTITPEVEFQAGSILDMSFVGTPVDGTWTLIELENANIVDNGLALLPGQGINWSFSINNSGTNGLLNVSYQSVPRTSVTVNSLAQLVQYMGDDKLDLTMSPGTYQIGPDDVTSGLLDDGDAHLLLFSGTDSTFDFTGVTFEIDTNVYRSFGNIEVRAIEITGEDLVLSNLTMVDIGTARPGRRAQAMKLGGWRNLVEGFTITLRGSAPYGYGDIFGKGGGSVIGHNKHSAILIGGDDNTLRNATLYHRSYGHGIFVQGAINTLIEGCYVEGELSTTDRVLAEAGTGSRADNAAFQTVWGFPLRAGNTFSLQEDGIRTYNTGADQMGEARNTANITVRDCTVYRMRSGVTIGFTNGTQDVDNCVAIQCENAYWIQNGSIMNSAADSQVGMVLASPYGNSGTKNVDLTIVRNDDEGQEDNRILAYIAGGNDNITFRSSAANTGVNQNMKLVVGGPRDSYRYETTDVGLSASNGVINNLTNYPVNLSSLSSNITGSSWGAVTDNGSSNSLTSTTSSDTGGYAMMQTIQAEDYTAESGTTQLATSNGGVSVGDLQDGDWIRFDDVIFGSGPKYIEALVAGGTNGGSIEVRLDTSAGTLLGTMNISGSATPENWVTETAAITRTQGIHDVYLVFKGGAGDLLEIDSFKFTERNFDPYNRDPYNLIAHYKFDEGAGSIATDASGNGYDGTISNASWVAGTEQTALAFDGSNSTVDIPAALLDNMEEEITVSLWVYGDDTQPLGDSVFYAQSAGGDRILNAHLPFSDSDIYWDAGDSSGYNRLQKTATPAQFEGQWNHWVFVKNTTQSEMLIYHNGELFAASQNGTDVIGDATVASIGSRLGGNNYFGKIDEVKFYNTAFRRNEVQELYDRYIEFDTYTLTYTAGANGSITGSSSQLVDEGNTGSPVTAAPDIGYVFVDWSDSSTDNPRTDTNVTSDITVTANFQAVPNKDAFAMIEGEDFDDQSGIDTQPSSEGGLNVQLIQNGDWTAYYNVDFGSGANEFQARVASNNSGGNIEIRLDSPTGTLLGTAIVPGTGNWQDYVTVNTNISSVSGVQQVYLVFTGGGSYLFNLNWFTFTNTYTLTYTAGTNGSITGTSPQTVDSGASGSAVTAVADANYSFVNWSDGSTNNPRTDLSVTGDVTVTANFTIDTYTLTYTAGANGSITGTSPQTIDHGADGTEVTAVAEANYSFVDWSDGSTDNPRTDLSITDVLTVTANFTIDTYTLAYTAGANGSITGTNPQTIDHGSNGTAVTAVADANYSFVDWSDGSTDNPRTDLSITDDLTVTANFTIDTYTLTYTAVANGSITGTTPQTIDHGADGTAVTAVADANYSFVDWSDGSTDNPRTDLSITDDLTVTANFTIDTYTLAYTASANGSITGTTPQTIDHGADGTAVTAVADANYSFVNWSDGSTDNPRTDLSVTDDITVTANFTIDTYTLAYTAGANGSITGTTPQTIDHGADGTAVTAVADANYSFVNWSDGSTDNPRTDLNVTDDISVIANFALTQTELDSWRFTHFGTYNNTGNAANDFDADFDGILNLIEYATGTDPNASSVGSFTIQPAAGSGLEVSFDRILDPSLTYTVEGTNDLSSQIWNPVWTGTGSSAGEVIVPDSSWPSGTNYFLRLSVSESE